MAAYILLKYGGLPNNTSRKTLHGPISTFKALVWTLGFAMVIWWLIVEPLWKWVTK